MRALARSISTILASSLLLAGCVGGDDDSSSAAQSSSAVPSTPSPSPAPSPSTPRAAASTTTLSGVAMAGAIDGTVCAYSLSDAGAVGASALACGATSSGTGAYTLTWNDYIGNVILKAFGRYIDEATGLSKSISEAHPMRSTVGCTGSACQAAVTPLTEAAVLSAGPLTAANLAAAYTRVAQAFGQNPSGNDDAFAKLVTLLPATAGNDSAAQYYARALAIVSQMQRDYCGASCTQDTYLTALQSLLANTSGVTDVQTAMNQALNAWTSNPNNTSGMDCYFANNVLTCNLPNSGNASGNGSSNNGSGNYKLTIVVVVQGMATPGVVINHIDKPSTQAQFCDSSDVKEQLNQSMSGAGGSWTLNSCSFSGNNGTISATVSQTTPIGPMTIPYTITYTYSSM